MSGQRGEYAPRPHRAPGFPLGETRYRDGKSSPRLRAAVLAGGYSLKVAPEPSPVQTWCGQSATQHTNSEPVILDPMPSSPPEGLSWCPACVGHLAGQLGLLDDIAESLAAYDPELYDDPEPRWARRRAARLPGGSGA